jgi:hypothetical protein
MSGVLAATWGMLGILLLLGHAIVRLTQIGIEALGFPLSWYHWVALAGWVVLMAYREGYAGFQQGFSPRVAARIAHLRAHPTMLRALLAPLFCIGFFHIERRKQFVVIGVTLMVVGFVIIARALPQPWRGIVDLGVVVGLLWGVISLVALTVRALGGRLDASPGVPGEGPEGA